MEETIKNVANYIIAGHTIEEATIHFAKSTSSIKKYLAKIRDENWEFYELILAEKLKLAQAKIILMGQKLGGQKGHRKRIRDEKTSKKLTEKYLSGTTFKELSKIENIPTSTLHDTIRSISDTELQTRIDDYIYNNSKKR